MISGCCFDIGSRLSNTDFSRGAVEPTKKTRLANSVDCGSVNGGLALRNAVQHFTSTVQQPAVKQFSCIMQLGSRGNPNRVKYWNDWVTSEDFNAMRQDPTVIQEWRQRRLLDQSQPPVGSTTKGNIIPPLYASNSLYSPGTTQQNEYLRNDHQQKEFQQNDYQRNEYQHTYYQQNLHQQNLHQQKQRAGVQHPPVNKGPQFLGKFGAGAQRPTQQPAATQQPAVMQQPAVTQPAVPQPLLQNRNPGLPYQNVQFKQQQQQQLGHNSVQTGISLEEEAWTVPFITSPGSGVPAVTKAEIIAMARILIGRHFHTKLLRSFPKGEVLRMVGAVAMVESSLQPFAYRYEERRGEASTGLMQVLQSTADWLSRDMGYRAYELDWAASMLYRPFDAVYFGLAYMEWLSEYSGRRRGEEFVVRGYNGGPGGAESQTTDYYWSKYQAAKKAFPFLGSESASPPTNQRQGSPCSQPSPNLLAPPQQTESGGRILFDLRNNVPPRGVQR